MDSPHITPYQPPVLTHDVPVRQPPPQENRPDAVPERTQPQAVLETDIAQLNPLAGLFDRGAESAAAKRIINQPVDDKQIRGRFVDVVA